jgi:hypothetical protein
MVIAGKLDGIAGSVREPSAFVRPVSTVLGAEHDRYDRSAANVRAHTLSPASSVTRICHRPLPQNFNVSQHLA